MLERQQFFTCDSFVWLPSCERHTPEFCETTERILYWNDLPSSFIYTNISLSGSEDISVLGGRELCAELYERQDSSNDSYSLRKRIYTLLIHQLFQILISNHIDRRSMHESFFVYKYSRLITFVTKNNYVVRMISCPIIAND